MRLWRVLWLVLTAPFRALWYLADTQNQVKAGFALKAFITPRLGARAVLLPPAILFGLMALVIVLLGEPGNWFHRVIGLLSLLLTVFVGGLYVVQLVNGEGGLEPRGSRSIPRRSPPAGIRGWFDRFGSRAQRLARRGDVPGLMALATDGSSKDRADAVNRLWGLLDKLSSSERDQFARIARSAMREGDAGVRGQAVFAVGALKEASDVDNLKASLDDADWLVRLAAAHALAWQEPPTAITSIARLLDDPEPMVREQVTEILRTVAGEAGAVRGVDEQPTRQRSR
jgi:hypothetical protein